MMPALSEAAIAEAMPRLEDEAVWREANALVLEFLHRHAMVKVWGEGTFVSADAMSLEASRHLWNARVDPRRRTYAIGIYSHVLDRWGIIYDQPLVLHQRQAGAAIEGIVRQTAAANVERLAVDTHGYTDFGMAISMLLGFDLCPRLSHLRDRRLHIPREVPVPQVLERVVDRDVSLRQLDLGWDQLIRVTASIDGGWTSAVLALERFGAAARADPIHKAGSALGKLLRSLFLCDYLSNLAFRREVLRILNHGESVHTLQRVIHFGSIAAARGRRQEALVAISGALTLLANIVMAWMTQHIQRVLDAWQHAGTRRVEGDQLRHIAPVHMQGINLRGVLQFPVARYRNRLILRPLPGRASGPMPPPKRHTHRRKLLILHGNLTQQNANPLILHTHEIVGFSTNCTDTPLCNLNRHIRGGNPRTLQHLEVSANLLYGFGHIILQRNRRGSFTRPRAPVALRSRRGIP